MVPDLVERDDLYKITILTDKYDMTEILWPWAKRCAAHIWDSVVKHKLDDGYEVLLWISGELGHNEMFVRTLENLLDQFPLDEDLKLCTPSKMRLQDNMYIASLGILGM